MQGLNAHNNKTEERRAGESGNALIYVLIAIALFAALSFILGRQTDSSEANVVSEEQTKLQATQMISYAGQVKSSIDQMLFSGSLVDDPVAPATTLESRKITFFKPGDTEYDNGANYRQIHMLYHPNGGGLSEKNIPEAIQADHSDESDPPPGWYIGRFNNVEWTPSASHDIILVAYKISQNVCEQINDKITGSTAIPQVDGKLRNYLIKEDATTPAHLDSNTGSHGGSGNVDLTNASTGGCPDCEGYGSLCVQNNAGRIFAFYTVVAER